jgi:hypothetical protein
MTKLPAPEQWVLSKMSEMETAEMIERHIEHYAVDKDGNRYPVHYPTPFVKHYMKRDDNALPIIVAIATAPLVLGYGELLAPKGFDRLRGIQFIIQDELRAVVPKREDCTEEAVKKAMEFLCDEWLCDAKTDFAGKCTVIVAALTMIDRSLLDQRPCFFVTAGRRGGGKTTLLTMLIMAVTGIMPATAAWSSNEEERRKALLAYFLAGVTYILWDNIPRGTQISCPHIEKSCTASYYADRKLGVSEAVCTAAATIHLFNGNNVGPKGDLASRSLNIRIDVDRADPENREFKHPDPIGWTEKNRVEIMAAFYTILLGNPRLKKPQDAPGRTRFKMWWRLVGSAVENAAKQVGREIDFHKLLIEQEKDDEESASLADVLEILLKRWEGRKFMASAVAGMINDRNRGEDGQTLRDFLMEGADAGHVFTSKVIGRRLFKHVDGPVYSGERTIVLRSEVDKSSNARIYEVQVIAAP